MPEQPQRVILSNGLSSSQVQSAHAVSRRRSDAGVRSTCFTQQDNRRHRTKLGSSLRHSFRPERQISPSTKSSLPKLAYCLR